MIISKLRRACNIKDECVNLNHKVVTEIQLKPYFLHKTKKGIKIHTNMGYLLSLEAISKAAKELKRSNSIVYTHGAYDLFHYGHLEFLRLSKEKGQILIVGIDSDELLPVYKNVKRPVINLEERLNIISKLQYVDFVFPLKYIPNIDSNVSKDKPSLYHLNIYKLLKPDIITYGKAYSGVKTIKRAKKTFKNIKFKKIIHKYSNIQSTTKVIDKILSSQN